MLPQEVIKPELINLLSSTGIGHHHHFDDSYQSRINPLFVAISPEMNGIVAILYSFGSGSYDTNASYVCTLYVYTCHTHVATNFIFTMYLVDLCILHT